MTDNGGVPEDDQDASWRERLQQLSEATDGSTHVDGIGLEDRVDRVAAFGSAILAIRWGITIASVALATQRLGDQTVLITVWSAVLLTYTVVRTIRPLRYTGDVRSLVALLGETALYVACLATTGFWESPFILTLLVVVALAGFARGFAFALRISLVASIAVSLPYLAETLDAERLVQSGQWTLVLVLVALISGYGRRISGEADRQHTLALDRLGRLADANALLYSLHRVTQTLPASLDLDDVLQTTFTRLRGLLDVGNAAILGLDDTDGHWTVLRREGGRPLPSRLELEDLPAPLRQALRDGGVLSVENLSVRNWPGLSPRSNSGVYCVLTARHSVIGILCVEHEDEGHFGPRDIELLKGFVEPVALAIDNARWFSRLRTVGADEERTRIARDLHDRIGQSLAYLAFELDRIVSAEGRGDEIGPALIQLRSDVRGVIREVRDTLYDLRTDVSETSSMADTLEAYTARIHERSALRVELYCDRDARLPLLQEREMWRIAQEALTNVERHAGASRARVLWRCNGEAASLEVTDDGKGFPIGRAGRLDSYGLMGMRERASSIGATLEVASEEGRGTRVRCSIHRPDVATLPAPKTEPAKL
ncbi:MAG: GAF domain-containing sensor histidine kinase [Acidimicrobiales bacterium]|jgi:signal transduction histidine kinase|nr:GAF domain-containing sensor histidine kinase [Acidimicrobiales bacterium]